MCSKLKIVGGMSNCLIAIGLLAASIALPVQAAQPRLVLQITVDALRGDLPQRSVDVLGEGGFRYLMDQGIHYTNAHYEHANTETQAEQRKSTLLRLSDAAMYVAKETGRNRTVVAGQPVPRRASQQQRFD